MAVLSCSLPKVCFWGGVRLCLSEGGSGLSKNLFQLEVFLRRFFFFFFKENHNGEEESIISTHLRSSWELEYSKEILYVSNHFPTVLSTIWAPCDHLLLPKHWAEVGCPCCTEAEVQHSDRWCVLKLGLLLPFPLLCSPLFLLSHIPHIFYPNSVHWKTH